MIGAINFNDDVNANDNLYIIALCAIQDSYFKFQDFFYDWRHEHHDNVNPNDNFVLLFLWLILAYALYGMLDLANEEINLQ